jgi:hypothetical protein
VIGLGVAAGAVLAAGLIPVATAPRARTCTVDAFGTVDISGGSNCIIDIGGTVDTSGNDSHVINIDATVNNSGTDVPTTNAINVGGTHDTLGQQASTNNFTNVNGILRPRIRRVISLISAGVRWTPSPLPLPAVSTRFRSDEAHGGNADSPRAATLSKEASRCTTPVIRHSPITSRDKGEIDDP